MFRLHIISTVAMAVIVLGSAGSLYAQVQTITATHTYTLGDNDSRNDARRICFLEAKRKVLEKAGVFIQTKTEVTNLQLSRDQINSYSAAVLSVEISNEVFEFQNGHNTLTLIVKAEFDSEDVRRRMAAIATDKDLQERITAQQKQLQRLEAQAEQLSSRLNLAPPSTSGELRKERMVVFHDIEEMDRKKLVAIQRISDEKEQLLEKSKILRKYIVPRMTMKEVESIAGKPLKEEHGYRNGIYGQDSTNWSYGELWVCFDTPLGAKDFRVYGLGPGGFLPDFDCVPNYLSNK